VKIVFCTPTLTKPLPAYQAALEASLPLLKEHGIEHSVSLEIGCPYISSAMATCVRKALDTMPDAMILLDDDMSWTPESLLKLILCDRDVVAGTYRYRKDEVEYMGCLNTLPDGTPQGSMGKLGALIDAKWLPTGFMKITANAVNKFMKAYPHLNCGPAYHPTPDLFNHGAHEGVWYGQDYAFCRNYAAIPGEKVWLMPDLDITHNGRDGKVYPGNYHQYLLQRPGGIKSVNPRPDVGGPDPRAQLRRLAG
jgi:hypothetical protein